MTLIAWYASIPIQAALLWQVLRNRAYPLFASWLGWDLLRSVVLICIYATAPRSNAYAWAFAISEPLDMILLALAGLEAAGASFYGWGLAIALATGSVLDFPLTDLPLRTQFLARALVAGSVTAALALRAGWGRLTAHGALLFAFCAVDLVSYAAIVMFWPRIDRARIQAFITVSQCLILAAWLHVHRKEKP